MVSVRPIRNEEDYEEAMARIGELLDELAGYDEQVNDPDHPSMVEFGSAVRPCGSLRIQDRAYETPHRD